MNFVLINFYRHWEMFWPVDVTHGEMHSSANDSQADGAGDASGK
jgi:hypothetical protein